MILTEQYLSHRQYVRRHNISLMQLHEFNHRLMDQLLPQSLYQGQILHSLLPDKPVLKMLCTERFKYTTEVSMQLLFPYSQSDELVIRVYHDAGLAELTHANEFERQYRALGGRVDAANQASLRYSQNCFLNKWLIFLLEKGHGKSNWQSPVVQPDLTP
ncbi:DUF1249 domain-containing protein [Marinicella sediminis]|uniref:DUF1249 domain-containing protein n=1 Tax=Marinicella sediminis TaxID=1792834 RepID=A0ABV7JAF8_9GAMM|nr:DUF1249 domain-containing protein [Marinicella sediminis]